MRDMQDEAGAPLIAADESPTTPQPTPDRRGLFGLLVGHGRRGLRRSTRPPRPGRCRSLDAGSPVNVVGEFIRLNLIRNAGAAFSIGDGATWVLTLIAFGVLVVIIRTARRIGSRGWAWRSACCSAARWATSPTG